MPSCKREVHSFRVCGNILLHSSMNLFQKWRESIFLEICRRAGGSSRQANSVDRQAGLSGTGNSTPILPASSHPLRSLPSTLQSCVGDLKKRTFPIRGYNGTETIRNASLCSVDAYDNSVTCS
uniref:Uncharacterized protein n=1 Tax=Odontella aurita TaxID=265563 RepID=A0A7S4NH42_9STRA